MAFRYFFNRSGAIVCGRDTLEECLAYAKRSMGWDIYTGKDKYLTEFAEVQATYKIEEHELLSSSHPDYWKNSFRRTYNDVSLDSSQAIMPFPSA